jgi:hypothetical protein
MGTSGGLHPIARVDHMDSLAPWFRPMSSQCFKSWQKLQKGGVAPGSMPLKRLVTSVLGTDVAF